MIKKWGVLLLILAMAISFAKAQEKKPLVVATASIFADMAEVISGGLVDVQSVVPIGGDPHIYEPTPADAQLIAKADLILKNDLTFEGWLTELIENSGTKAQVVTITQGIQPIESIKYKNSADPHAWMSAKNGLIYIKNITEALVALDSLHTREYEFNHDVYRQQLMEVDNYIESEIQKIPEQKRILITSHDAFRYYGKRYGITVEAILGTSTDADAQTSDLIRLNKIIKESGIPAVFIETTVNPKLLEQLATSNNIGIGGKLYSDSIGDKDSPAPSYLEMLRFNTNTIVAALTKESTPGEEPAEGDTESSNWWLFGVLGILLIGGFYIMFSKLNAQLMQSVISINGLSVSYERKRVLTNIYLEIGAGKVYGLIGPNGAGKSTLFKAILGLVDTNSGTVTIQGKPIRKVRKQMVYVPQTSEVDWNFPATVFDIVLMGRYPHKKIFEKIDAEDRALANDALKKLGIEHLQERQIGELSGGQQQRVFLARTLCQEADLFLLDEPFVGVDITTEEKIIELLKDLAQQGKTILVIHHDLSTVAEYFDRVILLNQRLIAFGDTDATFTEENISLTYRSQSAILHQTGLLDKQEFSSNRMGSAKGVYMMATK